MTQGVTYGEMSKQLLLFAPIAQRECDFYLNVAKILRDKKRLQVEFISFFQPGNEKLESAGFCVHDIYPHLTNASPENFDIETSQFEHQYGIENLQMLLIHEAVTFNCHNHEHLLLKIKKYTFVMEHILNQARKKFRRVYVFQELGGFIAPISLFLVAKRWRIPPCLF